MIFSIYLYNVQVTKFPWIFFSWCRSSAVKYMQQLFFCHQLVQHFENKTDLYYCKCFKFLNILLFVEFSFLHFLPEIMLLRPTFIMKHQLSFVSRTFIKFVYCVHISVLWKRNLTDIYIAFDKYVTLWYFIINVLRSVLDLS